MQLEGDAVGIFGLCVLVYALYVVLRARVTVGIRWGSTHRLSGMSARLVGMGYVAGGVLLLVAWKSAAGNTTSFAIIALVVIVGANFAGYFLGKPT